MFLYKVSTSSIPPWIWLGVWSERKSVVLHITISEEMPPAGQGISAQADPSMFCIYSLWLYCICYFLLLTIIIADVHKRKIPCWIPGGDTNPLAGCIWHKKNLPNQICGATCCVDPLWITEKLKVAFFILEWRKANKHIFSCTELKHNFWNLYLRI